MCGAGIRLSIKSITYDFCGKRLTPARLNTPPRATQSIQPDAAHVLHIRVSEPEKGVYKCKTGRVEIINNLRVEKESIERKKETSFLFFSVTSTFYGVLFFF
jgi:hypothetical protein